MFSKCKRILNVAQQLQFFHLLLLNLRSRKSIIVLFSSDNLVKQCKKLYYKYLSVRVLHF